MTPSELLRQHAAELLPIADALDNSGAPSAPAAVDRPDRLIDSATARRIAKVEYTTLRRWGRKFGIGFRTETGKWQFSEKGLRQVIAARPAGVANVQNVPADPLQMSPDMADVLVQR
jgi:hypothetical protein